MQKFILSMTIITGLMLYSPFHAQAQSASTTQPAAEAATSQPAEPTSQPAANPFAGNLTGDWFGLRTALADIGIKTVVYSNNYYGFNLRGGQDTTNAHRYSHTYDWTTSFDLEKMGLIPGGEIFMFYQGWLGRHRNINGKVGALSDPIDDADGHQSIYVDQLWYQQSFFEKKIQLRFGTLDYQGIVDKNAYANSEDKQFLNTSLDNNNVAAVPLPIGLGAALFVNPVDWLGFIIGAADSEAQLNRDGFDTAFHGRADYYGYFETDLKFKLDSANGPLPGNYRFGWVYDPRPRPEFRRWDAPLRRRPAHLENSDWGFYLSFDQLVWREGSDDPQGLGVFARYGVRDGTVNRLQHSWSTGLQYEGLVPTRDKDVFGFGVYGLHGSNDYQEEVSRELSRETGYEFYYSIQITPWMTFTPDLQYITQPGGSDENKDSLVMAFRLRITL
ncbi:MAG: Porin B [Phycisphaerae bacterium]|nr:Porin B [Phycisphaerae bacterium]